VYRRQCWEAAGRPTRPPQPIRYTSGQATARGTGGQITGFDGGPHDLFAGNTLASNGRIHGELVALVAP